MAYVPNVHTIHPKFYVILVIFNTIVGQIGWIVCTVGTQGWFGCWSRVELKSAGLQFPPGTEFDKPCSKGFKNVVFLLPQ